MKKSFLTTLLFVSLSCFACAQNISQDSQLLLNSYPFAVDAASLQGEFDLTIATLIEDMTPIDDLLTQAQDVSFITENGLYSGFGTAWYKEHSGSFSHIYEVDSYKWHCDLFSTSLISKENLVSPLFQPDLQVSLGYYNSF